MAFYFSYLINIGIYSVLIFTILVTFCKKMDKMFPKLNKKKKKWETLMEIYMQLLIVVSVSYILREFLNYFLKSPLKVRGSPDKFAILILGSPMFSQQPRLLSKIKYVWGGL